MKNKSLMNNIAVIVIYLLFFICSIVTILTRLYYAEFIALIDEDIIIASKYLSGYYFLYGIVASFVIIDFVFMFKDKLKEKKKR